MEVVGDTHGHALNVIWQPMQDQINIYQIAVQIDEQTVNANQIQLKLLNKHKHSQQMYKV